MPSTARRLTVRLAALYLLSILVVSAVGGTLAFLGHKRPVTVAPDTAYETVNFPSEARDKIALQGWLLPADSDLVAVIVHGWGGNRATLLPLAESIQKEGVNVLTFDLRGGTGRNTYGVQEAGDLAGAVDWLAKEKGFSPQRVVLIGNSMGGAAVTIYAAGHPSAGVILISSVYDIGQTRLQFAKDYHLLFPSLYAFGEQLVERYVYGLRTVNPVDLVPRLSGPVLILHGEQDEKAPFGDVATLRERFGKDPRFTFVTQPGGDHTYYTETAEGQATLEQETGAFLSRLR